MWDQISEKRLLEETTQRLLNLQKPHGKYCVHRVTIEDAWIWLPGGFEDDHLPADLTASSANITHDARLVLDQGMRRPLRRIITDPTRAPSVSAVERAAELLKATLNHCSVLNRFSNWAETEIHIFTPTGVDELVWFETTVAMWPEHQLPAWGFHTCNQGPSEWFPGLLASNNSAPRVLCLSIDSWANGLMNTQVRTLDPLGEAVSLVSFTRPSQLSDGRDASAPSLFPAIEQSHGARAGLPLDDLRTLGSLVTALCTRSDVAAQRIHTLVTDGHFRENRQHHLNHYISRYLVQLGSGQQIRTRPLLGEISAGAAEWVRIALGCQSARKSPGHAHLILDLTAADSTKGWVIG